MNGTIVKNGITYGTNISDSQPVGQIIESASEKTPAGYLPCDGRSLLRSDYPDLFKKIGTTYGAEDDEHFNLPSENQSSNNAILTSSTPDSDSKKVFVYPNFFVSQGVTFKLFFANGNSASSISVEINGNEYALKIYKAGTKTDVYAGMDAGTILEVFFDGTDLVLTSNPIVKQDISSTSGYTIYADGRIRQWHYNGNTINYGNSYTWNFPIPFNNLPIVTQQVGGAFSELNIAYMNIRACSSTSINLKNCCGVSISWIWLTAEGYLS